MTHSPNPTPFLGTHSPGFPSQIFLSSLKETLSLATQRSLQTNAPTPFCTHAPTNCSAPFSLALALPRGFAPACPNMSCTICPKRHIYTHPACTCLSLRNAFRVCRRRHRLRSPAVLKRPLPCPRPAPNNRTRCYSFHSFSLLTGRIPVLHPARLHVPPAALLPTVLLLLAGAWARHRLAPVPFQVNSLLHQHAQLKCATRHAQLLLL